MTRRVRSCSLLLAASVAVGTAQVPSTLSPEISPSRMLTLRLDAPHAETVIVNGDLDGKPHLMTKNPNGVWTLTLGPLAPDIYTYWFDVDGVISLDPQNAHAKFGYGRFGAASVVEVPGDSPQFYDARSVPHGEVRIVPYESQALGLARTMWVYTPPGYEKGSDFPVLYLLHGAGDVESGWVLVGRANFILDNLIAERRARPMVVVMPLGHAIQSFWTGPAKSVPEPAKVGLAGGDFETVITAMMAGDGAGGLSPFGKDLLFDVVPAVEKRFKVSARPQDRAIAGLSMGGGQAVNVAFNHPELFRYLAIMSPAVNANADQLYAATLGTPAVLNKAFKLFWIGVGRDDLLTGPGDRAFEELLTRRGVTHTLRLTEGRHEWTVWRHHLHEVAPLLFR